ncbi:hypothetical protein ACTOV4_02715 [Brucella sp. C7-11G]
MQATTEIWAKHMFNKKTDIDTILARLADKRQECWEAGDFVIRITQRSGSYKTTDYVIQFATAPCEEDDIDYLGKRFETEMQWLTDFTDEFGPNGYDTLSCYVVDETDDAYEVEEAFDILAANGLKMNLEIDFGKSSDMIGESAHFLLLGFEHRNEQLPFAMTFGSFATSEIIDYGKP